MQGLGASLQGEPQFGTLSLSASEFHKPCEEIAAYARVAALNGPENITESKAEQKKTLGRSGKLSLPTLRFHSLSATHLSTGNRRTRIARPNQ